ncbi:hypothetical protein MASR2M50_08950 [Thauera sp.]
MAVLAGLAGGDGLGLVDDLGEHRGDVGVPVGGQLAGHAALELGGELGVGGAVGGEGGVPLRLERGTLGAGVPGGVDVGRDVEGRVVPADVGACGLDLGGAERGAMHVVAVLLVGRAGADDGLAADQRGLGGVGLGLLDGGLDGDRVVALHVADHLPAVGFEALGRVVGEPALDMAVDGDVVVVVEGDELAQAPGAGERAGLVRDAFHQAAVAEEDVGVVVDHLMAGAVELGGEDLFGERHADRVGDALAERAGGGLDAGGVAVLGVAGGLAVELAEALELLDRQVVAGEVEQRVDQHRAMAVRQHEAVAVGPLGVGRVVLEVVAPEDFGDLGHAHGCARVAGVGLLHRVHREGADGAGDGVEDRGLDVAGRLHAVFGPEAAIGKVRNYPLKDPGDANVALRQCYGRRGRGGRRGCETVTGPERCAPPALAAPRCARGCPRRRTPRGRRRKLVAALLKHASPCFPRDALHLGAPEVGAHRPGPATLRVCG